MAPKPLFALADGNDGAGSAVRLPGWGSEVQFYLYVYALNLSPLLSFLVIYLNVLFFCTCFSCYFLLFGGSEVQFWPQNCGQGVWALGLAAVRTWKIGVRNRAAQREPGHPFEAGAGTSTFPPCLDLFSLHAPPATPKIPCCMISLFVSIVIFFGINNLVLLF